jgi:5-methyltetrahydropteroyltriglutamate--homocysteine methyltransferase
MASTDCGFASFAKLAPVMPDVDWMKLWSLVVGVAIATERLWGCPQEALPEAG